MLDKKLRMVILRGQDLLEFSARFKTDLACEEYLAETKWGAGYKCRKCGHAKFQIRMDLSGTCIPPQKSQTQLQRSRGTNMRQPTSFQNSLLQVATALAVIPSLRLGILKIESVPQKDGTLKSERLKVQESVLQTPDNVVKTVKPKT